MDQHRTEINQVLNTQIDRVIYHNDNIMSLLDMGQAESEISSAEYINTFQLELLDDDSSDTQSSLSPYSAISEDSSTQNENLPLISTTKIRYELFQQLSQVALKELEAILEHDESSVKQILPHRKRKFHVIENVKFYSPSAKFRKITSNNFDSNSSSKMISPEDETRKIQLDDMTINLCD